MCEKWNRRTEDDDRQGIKNTKINWTLFNRLDDMIHEGIYYNHHINYKISRELNLYDELQITFRWFNQLNKSCTSKSNAALSSNLNDENKKKRIF